VRLCFVTPAWQRVDLTAVCLEQRRRVIARLQAAGVEASCVVIADDANLDTARALGFDVIEQRNELGLGRKFNAGMEYAAGHGADWIVPIGSDSWIDPEYVLPLPPTGLARTSPIYCVVTSDQLAELRVMSDTGAGPYMFHRSLLEPAGFRPARDELMRHVDHSTIKGIGASRIRWRARDVHALQYVGFRGRPTITSYDKLVAAWGVAEHPDPWVRLATRYDADLVELARKALQA